MQQHLKHAGSARRTPHPLRMGLVSNRRAKASTRGPVPVAVRLSAPIRRPWATEMSRRSQAGSGGRRRKARNDVVRARLRTAAILMGIVLLSSEALADQAGATAGDSAQNRHVVDRPARPEPALSLLPNGSFSTMHMLLEKTILSVDVLTLDVRIDAAGAGRIADALAGVEQRDDGSEALVAEVALEADELVGRIEFQRDVRLDQFLDAINDDMQKAVDVGWLEPAAYREVRDGLPIWFSFLEERRIRDGDRLSYHVRRDTLRTVFATRAGEVLLDQTDVGGQNVVALVGAWFAPGSSFREKLVQSLFDRYLP